MSRKAASGTGTIRKKTVTRKGKEYTYWEARYSAGRDPGTGQQIQRSITGKTQKEVAQKLKAATASIDAGTYIPPCRMTVNEWMDIWAKDYLGSVKPTTVSVYRNNIEKHIKPALGAIAISKLQPHMVQEFINGISLAPSSVILAYKVLHQALERAVKLGYIPRNPATGCELPRREQTEIRPLEDEEVSSLLLAIKGHSLEIFIKVALFTGLRQSELLGLTWDCVDFDRSTILVNKQLSRKKFRSTSSIFTSPKNGRGRTITSAYSVMKLLREQKRRQAEMQLKAGPLWENEYGLVFTDDFGAPIAQSSVRDSFRLLADSIGLSDTRFHDLRHTYAVNAIRAGDDIKTVQGNLGHSSAAFTLDRYGHFTERMKQDSADRMENFMKSVLGL